MAPLSQSNRVGSGNMMESSIAEFFKLNTTFFVFFVQFKKLDRGYSSSSVNSKVCQEKKFILSLVTEKRNYLAV